MKSTVVYSTFLVLITLFFGCGSDTDQKKSDAKNTANEAVTVQDSISILNELIKANPSDPELYYNKSLVYLKQMQTNEALDELDRAISADSTEPKYYLKKSSIYFDIKQLDKARLEAERVLAFDEGNAMANVRMAWIALMVKNPEKVFEFANNALRTDINMAEAYFVKGLMYKEQGKFKEAVSSFRTATEQDNSYYDAWVELGLLHALARHELTTYYYDNAINVDSTRYDAHYNKGYYLQEQGEYREALKEYAVINRNTPNFYNAYYNRGFIYLEYLAEYDSAAIEFSKVVGLNPLNYKAFYNRGLSYERAGELRMAVADYEEALRLNPGYDLAAEAKSRLAK